LRNFSKKILEIDKCTKTVHIIQTCGLWGPRAASLSRDPKGVIDIKKSPLHDKHAYLIALHSAIEATTPGHHITRRAAIPMTPVWVLPSTYDAPCQVANTPTASMGIRPTEYPYCQCGYLTTTYHAPCQVANTPTASVGISEAGTILARPSAIAHTTTLVSSRIEYPYCQCGY
jgi:hypothetical protein